MAQAAGAPVISVHGLVKTFGRFRALDCLDLTVLPGEVHGFLGPNGAGRSTTIRALLGLLRTDEGSAMVFGRDPGRDAVQIHRRLAYVPALPRCCGPRLVALPDPRHRLTPSTRSRAC
jgi:ABC-2 type transport system ATP-binding protein